jgi:hypothetical protein
MKLANLLGKADVNADAVSKKILGDASQSPHLYYSLTK